MAKSKTGQQVVAFVLWGIFALIVYVYAWPRLRPALKSALQSAKSAAGGGGSAAKPNAQVPQSNGGAQSKGGSPTSGGQSSAAGSNSAQSGLVSSSPLLLSFATKGGAPGSAQRSNWIQTVFGSAPGPTSATTPDGGLIPFNTFDVLAITGPAPVTNADTFDTGGDLIPNDSFAWITDLFGFAPDPQDMDPGDGGLIPEDNGSSDSGGDFGGGGSYDGGDLGGYSDSYVDYSGYDYTDDSTLYA